MQNLFFPEVRSWILLVYTRDLEVVKWETFDAGLADEQNKEQLTSCK